MAEVRGTSFDISIYMRRELQDNLSENNIQLNLFDFFAQLFNIKF